MTEPTDTLPPLGSESVTQGFRVRVWPAYLADQSSPDQSEYVFGYTIRIDNQDDQAAQLLRRRWVIIDADGQHHEVDGEGVVGRQPYLRPGEGFEYSSFCPLPTPWGTMEGAFSMERDDGAAIEVKVGRFFLVATDELAPTSAVKF